MTTTHAGLAATLLTEAAAFFRSLGEQNQPLRTQMAENAAIFIQMAEILEKKPAEAAPDGTPYAHLGAKLLKDAAAFFRMLADRNEPLREQMEENARIFEQLADGLAENPLAVMD